MSNLARLRKARVEAFAANATAANAVKAKETALAASRAERNAEQAELNTPNTPNINSEVNDAASQTAHVAALDRIQDAIESMSKLSTNKAEYNEFKGATNKLRTAVNATNDKTYADLMQMKFGYYTIGTERKNTFNNNGESRKEALNGLVSIQKNLKNTLNNTNEGPKRSTVMNALFKSVLLFLANKLTLIRSKKEAALTKLKENNNANQADLQALRNEANAAANAAKAANTAAKETEAAITIQAAFRRSKEAKEAKAGTNAAKGVNAAVLNFIRSLKRMTNKPANAAAVEGQAPAAEPAAASGNGNNKRNAARAAFKTAVTGENAPGAMKALEIGGYKQPSNIFNQNVTNNKAVLNAFANL